MKKNKFYSLRLVITFALVLILLYTINFTEFIAAVRKINPIFLMIPLLLYIPSVFTSSYKWDLILKNVYGLKYRFLYLVRVYFIGAFYNNFLPSTIGGDAYRYFALKKEYDAGRKEILSSVLIERGSGFFALFVVNFIAASFLLGFIRANSVVLYIEMALALGFIAGLIAIRFHTLLKKIRFLGPWIETLAQILKNKKAMLQAIALSVIFVIMVILSHYILLLGLGVHISLLHLAFIYTVVSITSILPISLNNIGVTEGIYIFLFTKFGVGAESALLFAVIGRVLLILASLVGGVLHLMPGREGKIEK